MGKTIRYGIRIESDLEKFPRIYWMIFYEHQEEYGRFEEVHLRVVQQCDSCAKLIIPGKDKCWASKARFYYNCYLCDGCYNNAPKIIAVHKELSEPYHSCFDEEMEKRFKEFRLRLLKEGLIEFPSEEELRLAYVRSGLRIPYQKEDEASPSIEVHPSKSRAKLESWQKTRSELAGEEAERQVQNLAAEVEQRMNRVLEKLGLPFKVKWTPDPSRNHGNIDLAAKTLHIHDVDEQEAWETLGHEIVELKLKPVLDVYRLMVNALIDAFEKACYKRKEEFIESLPKVLAVIEEARKDNETAKNNK